MKNFLKYFVIYLIYIIMISVVESITFVNTEKGTLEISPFLSFGVPIFLYLLLKKVMPLVKILLITQNDREIKVQNKITRKILMWLSLISVVISFTLENDGSYYFFLFALAFLLIFAVLKVISIFDNSRLSVNHKESIDKGKNDSYMSNDDLKNDKKQYLSEVIEWRSNLYSFAVYDIFKKCFVNDKYDISYGPYVYDEDRISFINEHLIFKDTWILEIKKELFNNDSKIGKRICRFTLADFGPTDISYVAYCVCDNEGNQITSYIYRKQIVYVDNYCFFLFAYLPEKVEIENVNLCICNFDSHIRGINNSTFNYKLNNFPSVPTPSEMAIIDQVQAVWEKGYVKSFEENKRIVGSSAKWEITEESYSENIDIYQNMNVSQELVDVVKGNAAIKKAQREPLKRKASTSFPEQAIYYYVRMYFGDAQNRYKIDNKIEADVYIPSINVAIEYDGGYWHDKKFDSDIKKNREISDRGIFLIRVRDAGLPDLPNFNGVVLIHKNNNMDGLHSNEYITEIMHILSNFVDDENQKRKLLDFELSYERLKNDRSSIYALLYDIPCENNATKWQWFKYWNYEMNGDLDPKCLPINANVSVWLTCKVGDRVSVPVGAMPMQYCFDDQQICKMSVYCDNNICKYNYYSKYCSKDYIERAIECYIKGEYIISDTELLEIRRYLNTSHKTIELMKNRIDGKYFENEIERFNVLFFHNYSPKKSCALYIESITNMEDFYIVSKFRNLYGKTIIRFRVNSIDVNKENRLILVNYCKKLILKYDVDPYEAVSMYFGRISEELTNAILKMLKDVRVRWKISRSDISYDNLIASYTDSIKRHLEHQNKQEKKTD